MASFWCSGLSTLDSSGHHDEPSPAAGARWPIAARGRAFGELRKLHPHVSRHSVGDAVLGHQREAMRPVEFVRPGQYPSKQKFLQWHDFGSWHDNRHGVGNGADLPVDFVHAAYASRQRRTGAAQRGNLDASIGLRTKAGVPMRRSRNRRCGIRGLAPRRKHHVAARRCPAGGVRASVMAIRDTSLHCWYCDRHDSHAALSSARCGRLLRRSAPRSDSGCVPARRRDRLRARDLIDHPGAAPL